MPHHEPRRTCVGCRTERDKPDLMRVVRTAAGETLLDPSGKLSGRGAYVCRDVACLDLAVKRKALERALKGPVSAEVVQSLRDALTAG